MKNTTNPATIYLVRHGETDWNVKNITQGQSNSILTQKGEQQAHALRERLQHVHFDAIFSSDLTRAVRTAEILAAQRKLAINTTVLIRERSMGVYEGKPISVFTEENKALIERYWGLPPHEQWTFKYAHDIESSAELVSRTVTFLREVAVTYAGNTILIVTHGGVMRRLLVHLGWATFPEMGRGTIDNTGYVVLESDGIDFIIKEMYGVRKNNNSGN